MILQGNYWVICSWITYLKWQWLFYFLRTCLFPLSLPILLPYLTVYISSTAGVLLQAGTAYLSRSVVGHCVACPSSTYGFWLSLWYLPNFLLIFKRVKYNLMTIHSNNKRKNTYIIDWWKKYIMTRK
jgi:hypothetical protein